MSVNGIWGSAADGIPSVKCSGLSPSAVGDDDEACVSGRVINKTTNPPFSRREYIKDNHSSSVPESCFPDNAIVRAGSSNKKKKGRREGG